MMEPLLPLTTLLLRQIAAYLRYFIEMRDHGALLLAAMFLIVAPAPALFIDFLRLVTRITESSAPTGPKSGERGLRIP